MPQTATDWTCPGCGKKWRTAFTYDEEGADEKSVSHLVLCPDPECGHTHAEMYPAGWTNVKMDVQPRD